jgi:50S ribosomal protein L16 3-hydroxylase
MRAMPWLRWSSPVLAPSPQAKKQTPGSGVRRNDEAGGSLDVSVLRNWFGRFITRYRSAQIVAANPRPLTDAAFARALAAGAQVQRNPWSRCAWMREGRHAALFVSGERHACSLALARLICAHARFGLTDTTLAGDRSVLRALIDAGHLAIMRASQRRSGR